MVTEDQVRQALRNVLDPEIGKPIEDIGMLQGIEVNDGSVRVHVLITIEGCPLKDRITADVTNALQPLGVERVEVDLSPMSEEQRTELVTKLRGGAAAAAPQQQRQFFVGTDTTVIAVASGKGGVGKSSVTVNIACALAAEGYRVGVLDADVWGFSVPRMMGVTGKPVGFNNMILPLESHGVKVISMGFFVPEETPVIWRGPMLHKAIEQFLGDVYWGDLDFLSGRPAPRHRRRVDLARVVPARRLHAGRHHAAGSRSQGGGARREDGRAHEPPPARGDREHVVVRLPPLRGADVDLRRGRRAGGRGHARRPAVRPGPAGAGPP